MKESFPEDEYRTYEGQKALLDDDAYRIYGIREEDGNVLGVLAVWDLEEYAFLEHFAVSPAYRNLGIGRDALADLIAISQKPVCLEVEPPESEITRRRVGFYSRNGFFLNNYSYFQPSLAEGRTAVPLYIMTYGRSVDESEFLKIKNTLYTRVYKCK